MAIINELIEQLHKLTDSIDFENFNLLTSKKYIDELSSFADKNPIPSFILTTQPKGISLTRAVNWKKDGCYYNIKEFGPPPTENILVPGRANFPHQSVLYCSEVPGTCLFEIKPSANGEFIGLLTFKIDRTLKLISFGLESYKYANKVGFDEKDIAINNFFGEKFKESIPNNQEYKYYPTAIISNLFYPNNIDGIIFPSVATNLIGENIALKTSIIEELELIEDLRIVQVFDYKDPLNFKTRCVRSLKSIEKGKLEWKSVNCEGHHLTENIFHNKKK